MPVFSAVASLWVGKLIIDAVVNATRTPSASLRRLWELVALEIAILLGGEAISRASRLVESLFGGLYSKHISIRLMEHAATLDLYQFEDPIFYDKLERARGESTGRLAALTELLALGQQALTLFSLGAVLFIYSPWLLVLLAITVLPSFLGETRFATLEFLLLHRQTQERRMLDYIRYLGASGGQAKEVQMFDLSPWLIERFRRLAEKFHAEAMRLSTRRAMVSFIFSVVSTFGYYSAYVCILWDAAHSAITLGALTFLSSSFASSRGLLQQLLNGASGIYAHCLHLKDLFEFFDMRPTITSPAGAPEVPQPIREGFIFEDVGFRYPGSDQWAVRHVNFRLSVGERIALVGENGAGKTTLTKLLARLYDPAEGRILLDGRDLREYDLHSLRRAIGVIFQDFVRYDLRFNENVGVGEIAKVRHYLDAAQNGFAADGVVKTTSNGNDLVPTEIAVAAEKSLATSLLPRFLEGYRQMLGRRFQDGVDLSGGEWQKIALARAYMRDAQALILDEPTAALDARAEYEVFKRFSELVQGRMVVIISHRFSTVRIADRIIVLKGGIIIEDGTHDELLVKKGLYAELFAMQAVGYR
jgi:ATP-binding cassette subfamily B protein